MHNKDLQNETSIPVPFDRARVGMIGDYEIFIRTDDPDIIPHFHIRDYSTKGEKLHTCIRIEGAEYLHHTGKQDVLNHELRNKLVDFLRSESRRKGRTNWDVLIDAWNMNNSDVEVDINQEMPDYMELK